MFIVYDKTGQNIRIELDKLEYNGSFMGESFVMFNFNSPVPVDFEIGDYLEYRGEKFVLNYTPSATKNCSSGKNGDSFVYTDVKFNSLADELTRCDFLDVVLADNHVHFTSLSKFSFYAATVKDLADRIQANLNRLYSGGEAWTVTVEEEVAVKDKSLSVDNINCWEALSLVNSDFDANFVISGRTIRIGTAGISVGKVFGYGKGNGLINIEQSTNNDSLIVTRLRAYGSNRNLPYRYYNNLKDSHGNSLIPESMYVNNLMLPGFAESGGDIYIDSPNISKIGIREKSVYFDGSGDLPEIYPSIEGMTAEELKEAGVVVNATGRIDEIVSAEQITDDGVIPEGKEELEKKTFTITLKDIGFNPVDDKHITTETPMISMKTGWCGGREFEITGCEKKGNNYILTCNREMDSSINKAFPNTPYQVSVNDQFVLVGIAMDDIYIKAAEQRLLTAAKDYLSSNDKSKYTYLPKIDNVFMARNPEIASTLKEGNVLDFKDVDLDIDASVIIQSLIITEGGAVPEYEITLFNDKILSGIDKIQNSINQIANNTGITVEQAKSFFATWVEAWRTRWFDQKLHTFDPVKFNSITSTEFESKVKGWLIDALGNAEFRDLLIRSFKSWNFAAGPLGAGVGMVNDDELQTDKLLVRKTMYVLEMMIQRMRYQGGIIVLSPATGFKIDSVEVFDTYYRVHCRPEDLNEFEVNDQARIQNFTGNNIKYLWSLVLAKGDKHVDISRVDKDGDGVPSVGDEIVQLGNRTNPERQDAVLLSAVNGEVGLFTYFGINSFDLSGKEGSWFGKHGGKKGAVIKGEVHITSGSSGLGQFTEYEDIDERIQNAQDSATSVQEVVNNLTSIIIPDLQGQIDGSIMSHEGTVPPTLTNKPAVDWTTEEERNRHLGDYYDYFLTVDGEQVTERYKFSKLNGTYQWVRVADSGSALAASVAREALGLAGTKAAITWGNSLPTVPYNINDVWIKTNGSMYICNHQRLEGETGSQSDWQLFNDTQLRLAQMAADNVISIEEKPALRDTWDQIKEEFKAYQAQATKYGVSITALQNAYNTLNTFLTNTVNISQDVDTTLSVAQKTEYNQDFANYYSERTAFANVIAQKVADESVGNLQIGMVNLLKGSNVELGAQAYLLGIYYFDKKPEVGKTYTLVICYTLGEDNTSIRAYQDGGSYLISYFSTKGDRVVKSITFKYSAPNSPNNMSFYQFPNGTYGSKVHWTVLVEGNKGPNSWIPSQADNDAKAQAIAKAEAELAEVKANAYADGIVTEAEQNAINEAQARLDALKIGSVNLVSRKMMLDWNNKKDGIAVWGQDADGIYLGINQGALYTYVCGGTAHNDLFGGTIKYKDNTQYVFQVKWKLAGEQTNNNSGVSFWALYTDGTSEGMRLGSLQTSLIVESFITKKGKTVEKIFSSYGDNVYRSLIYSLALYEGNKVLTEIPVASEDLIGQSNVNLLDNSKFQFGTEGYAPNQQATLSIVDGILQVRSSQTSSTPGVRLPIVHLKPGVYTIKANIVRINMNSFGIYVYTKDVSKLLSGKTIEIYPSYTDISYTFAISSEDDYRIAMLWSATAEVSAGFNLKYLMLTAGEISPQDWNPSPGDVAKDIKDVSDAVSNLSTTINGAFKDGIIDEAEAKAIASNISILNAEKADIDAYYNKLYANTYLTGTAKTNLASAKTAYNTAHTNLINSINTAIADGKATATEKADVDAKFTAYNTALSTYKTRVGEADKAIQDQIKALAEQDATNKVDGIQIGVRNLFLDSGVGITSNSYYLKRYETSIDLLPNKKYTAVVRGTTTGGQQIGAWFNNGGSRAFILPANMNDDVVFVHFTSIASVTEKNALSFYNYPQSGASDNPATIKWVALYEGHIKPPLDWVQAPEDVDQAIQDAIAKTVDITSPSQVFKYGPGYTGTPTPSSIVLTATPRNFTPTSYQWQYLNGSTWTNISGATSSTYSIAPGNTTLFPSGTNVRTFRCICNGDEKLSDSFTIAKLADGATGATGADGKGVSSTVTTYQASTSGTTAPTGTWSSTIPAVPAGQFLWTRTVINYTSGSPSTMYSVSKIGADGTNGNAGNGVSSTVITYQASTSGTTAPTGTWSSSIPSVPAGQYLWTRTVINYTSGSPSTIYSVGMIGKTGADGKDAYTILLGNESHAFAGSTAAALAGSTTCSVMAYKGATQVAATVGTISGLPTGMTASVASNGTTAPVITFTVTTSMKTASGTVNIPVTVDGKSFTKVFSYSIAFKGDTGSAGKGVKSTAIAYQASSSGTTTPTGTWSSSIPAVAAGQYLWTRTIITYTDDTTSTMYSVGRMGTNGTNGNAGNGVSSTTITYQASTSGTTAPTGTWNSSIPSVPAGQYLWTRTVINYTSGSPSTIYSVGMIGKTGADGKDAYTILLGNESHAFAGSTAAALAGSTTCSVMAYKGATQVAATVGTISGLPTGMTASVASNGTTAPVITFTVTTSMKTASGTVNIPVTVDGKSFTKVFSYSIAFKGDTGSAGKGVKSTAIAYQASSSGTTTPTGTWSSSIPAVAAGQYLWTRTIITYTDDTTSTMYSVGRMGTNGTNGNAGNGVSSTTITYQASTSGTTAPTGTWNSSIPSVPAGQYLWTRTVINYTNGSSSTIYSVGRIGEQGIPGESINGKMLYKDPEFKLGVNKVYKYTNSSNVDPDYIASKLTVERVAKPSDAPTQSGYCLKITCKATQSPGYGGVYQPITSRANAVFVQKIIAKIPVGYKINTASNSMGTGYTDTWLTPTEGTGKYTTYLRKVVCGATGTFRAGGHVYINGGPAPTESAPLEWYIAFMTCFDQTSDGYADIEIVTKDSFAVQMGYTSFQNMIDQTVAKGGKLVVDGLLNAKLIDVEALAADTAFVNKLLANDALIGNIKANMLSVAGFTFQDHYIFGGKDFGLGPGVKITSIEGDLSFKAYKDASNYISMFYNSASDWGLKGVVGESTVFQLGNPGGAGTFIGPFNFTRTQLISSSDVTIGSNTYKQGFTLENNKISFSRAMSSIYQKRIEVGIANNAYGSDTLLAVEGGDIWHQGTVTTPSGSGYTSRPCRFYASDIQLRGDINMYETAAINNPDGNPLIKKGFFCAPFKTLSLYGTSMSFSPTAIMYAINTIGSAGVNVTINTGYKGQILILLNYAQKNFNIVNSSGALITRVPSEKSAILYCDGNSWGGIMVGDFYRT